jgi:hypothetical protein
MAKKQGLQDTNKVTTNSFIKGLNKDSDPSFVSEGMWTHAVNMVNNTVEGDIGTLSNEISNILCGLTGQSMPAIVTDKYIIGAIYLYSDKWIIYTAGHNSAGKRLMSEIGLFEEDVCKYREIVQDACLNFDKRYLISGSSRQKEDCSWQVYWADGFNPDRFLNVGDPKLWPTSDYSWLGGGTSSINYYSNGVNTEFLWPGVTWNETDQVINDCNYVVQINTLDCPHTRLARLMDTPCINLKLGQQGGTMANGTYFALIAYTIKGQKVTDYFSQSNFQFIYSPNDLEGSLTMDISVDSENFDEFELVVVEATNQQTVASRIGLYSTRTSVIALDQINPSLIKIPLALLPIQTPVFETSDQITDVNSYLLKVGPRSKFDFNYQPLANMISTKWASVEYPADYYMKGGNKTNYLRDEVYTFYIRWIYDTGDKSASYHIPGRAPRFFNVPNVGSIFETADLDVANSLATDDKVFEVYNTATQSLYPTTLPNATQNASGQWVMDDGGVLLAIGEMGYWESTEVYPDNRPDIWNSSEYCWTGPAAQPSNDQKFGPFDLCGKNIRHHKFPENFITNSTTTDALHFRPNTNINISGQDYNIRLMGVVFENITLPKDQDGIDIPGIVGYEILRGSREGNKTIIAKGMVNNFRTFKPRGAVSQNRTGLYANYPYNTIIPIGNDVNNQLFSNYLYNDPYIKNGNIINQQTIPTDIFTFHSPDTMFRTPFLSTTEFKVYGTLNGNANLAFQEANGHPKWKLLSNAVVAAMIIGGVIETVISMVGKKTVNSPKIVSAGLISGAVPVPSDAAMAAQIAANVILSGASTTYNTTVFAPYYTGAGPIVDLLASIFGGYTLTPTAIANQALAAAINAAAASGSVAPVILDSATELPKFAYLDPVTRVFAAINSLSFYFAEGAELVLRSFYTFIQYKQYALQQVSHGFYGNMTNLPTTNLNRFKIEDSFYIRDNVQEVPKYQTNTGTFFSYNINNLKRSDAVVVRTKSGPYFNGTFPDGVTIGPNLITSGITDKSLVTLGTVVQNSGNAAFIGGNLPSFDDDDKSLPFSLPIASHYGGLKGRVRNQYGQLGSEHEITITTCEQKLQNYNIAQPTWTCPIDNILYDFKIITRTPLLFGGDTYINRYTEKNNMVFFYDWLYNQPDGFEYNYYIRSMIPLARFKVNSIRYDIGNLSDLFNFSSPSAPGTGAYPSAFYNLDYYVNSNRYYNYELDISEGSFIGDKYKGLWSVNEAYFYLANSGIRDFFVESEVIVDFRKQSALEGGKHYDPYRYTDYVAMFNMNPNIMGMLSEYIYDYSLSVSKLYNQYFSAGSVQSRYYDPNVAKLCYTYYPDRIIYSLPQQMEAIKDSWFIYLVNNYKEFIGQIAGVKSINKSGIFITFKNESPLMYQGVDQLQTELGTKITIGDGGLFSQPQQSVSNADNAYEYGSSQNRLSVISTPVGIFYMSQNQGRIFSYGQGLQEISQAGLKWWLVLYMPYKLIDDFPDYPWQDNPVAGIGCQSTYDSSSTILYFCKKDYQLKPEFKNRVTYRELNDDGTGDDFILDGQQNLRFNIGDPYLFYDASWTLSYDPKNQFFISFHDWHPDLLIPTKDIFISTKKNSLWKHNYICDGYTNYYGTQYGYEIEFPVVTGQSVMTTKSIEYILEAYRRNGDSCIDQHHVLDYNFDRAVIYNTEQVSGYLNLNIYPKNDVNLSLQYPKLNSNLTSYDILFSKEENKYRFNQFWDITRERAEFPTGSNYPPTGPVVPGSTVLQGSYSSENTWITAPDGVTRILNPNNMNYDKPQLQRKKFRHYLNFINLRKEQGDDVNVIFKMSNSKNQFSPR